MYGSSVEFCMLAMRKREERGVAKGGERDGREVVVRIQVEELVG